MIALRTPRAPRALSPSSLRTGSRGFGSLRRLALSLLLAAPLATAQVGRAQELDAELLVAHPGRAIGDHDAWAADLLDALERDPASPLALDALQRLASLEPAALDGAGGAVRLSALRARVRDGEVAWALEELVLEAARRRRFSSDPYLPLAELHAEALDRWQVLGPLGPLDDASPATLPAPDDSPEPRPGDDPVARLEAQRLTPAGDPATWRTVDLLRNEWALFPAAHVWPAAGLAYARTALRDEAGAERLLEVRSNGPLRVYWNGELALDVPRAGGEPEPARQRVRVRSQGHDVLLLRVPAGDERGVVVRLLDASGELLPEGRVTNLPYEPGTWRPRPGSRVTPDDGDLRAPAAGPHGPALEIERALRRGRPDQALCVPEPEDPAGRTTWHLGRLDALEAAQHLPPEIVRRRTLEHLEALEQDGSPPAEAREVRLRLLLREDRPVEALEQAEAWCAWTPEAVRPELLRALCWNTLEQEGVQARGLLQALRVAHPEHRAVLDASADLALRGGDSGGAVDLALATLEQDGSEGALLERLLNLLGDSGDPRLEVLLERARAWCEAFPADGTARLALDGLLAACGRRDELLQRLAADVDRRPGTPGPLWALARQQVVNGDLEGARATWRRLLALDPGSAPVRLALERMGDEDPAERFFAAFAPDRDAALEAAADVTDASVVEALDSGLVYLFPDGSLQARYQTLSVPRDRAGTEQLHESPVAAGTLVAQVLGADGARREPVAVQGNWVLPSLEPGDVVEFVWDRQQRGLPGVATDVGVWRFASFERAFPTSRWVVFVPDGLPGELVTRNFTGQHTSQPWEGGSVHFLQNGSERLVEEPLRPSDLEVLPWATRGADRERRGELAAWRTQLAQLSAIPADLEQEVAAFAASFEGDDGTRARALYEALDTRTRDHQGQPFAPHVWLLRRGMPLFLLAAVYERAGVPFEWAVLESTTAPELDPEPVSPFAGQRPLAQMALRLGVTDADGEPVWILPPPGPGFPFGAIPDPLAGARALVLEGDGPGGAARAESLPRNQLERSWSADLELTYRLQEDGSAQVVGRFVDSSPTGEVGRRQLAEVPREQLERVARNLAGQSVPGLDLEQATFDLLGEAERGLVLDFRGRVPGFVSVQGERGEASLRLANLGLSTGFGPAQRRFPLALRNALRRRVRVTVEGGDAWRLVAGPDALDEEASGFRLSLRPELDDEGRRFHVERTLELRGLRLEPAEMTGFLNRMGVAEAESQRPLQLVRRER